MNSAPSVVGTSRLGTSGLRVSDIALGTATWGEGTGLDDARRMIAAFTAAGGNLVDTSPAYTGGAAQSMLGEVLKEVPRESLIISSAAGVDPTLPMGQRVDCSRRALFSQVDTTLRTLGTDYLDLFSVGYWDGLVPEEELRDIFDSLVTAGKIRYPGVRGYNAWQLAATHRPGARSIISAQTEYSLLMRGAEEHLIPAARHLGVGVLAAAPLARGVLTGRGSSTNSPNNSTPLRTDAHPYLGRRAQTVIDALSTAADGLGISPTTAAVAWTRDRPGVASVVVGASHIRQLDEILAATDVRLPPAIDRALEDISR